MKLVFSVVIAFCLASCGFTKTPAGSAEKEKAALSSLQIGPEDWSVVTGETNAIRHRTSVVRSEKLDFLRRNFRMPKLSGVTVPESGGFEIYEVTGYPELENQSFIHPKLYINSATDRGTILGYRADKKDAAGNELVEISIPVALVNGLVESVPLVGGPHSGAGAAISLPASFRIPDVDALKKRLGRELKTLPVCPKRFRLSFEKSEIWAVSPFSNLSSCPLNQFFRIKFEAPISEMRRILEMAALREETVTLSTDLEAAFEYPVKRVDLAFPLGSFKAELEGRISKLPKQGTAAGKAPLFSVADLEDALVETIFALSRTAGFSPKGSRELSRTVSDLINLYFSSPVMCASHGICRVLLAHPLQKSPIEYGWLETESLGGSLQTQTVSHLGSVANSSRFIGTPAHDQLEAMRRPEYFRARPFGDVVRECVILVVKTKFEDLPGSSDEERKRIRAFCVAIAENTPWDSKGTPITDGYYPLGNNTTVYPGAWLRLDIDGISEFTTAKTRTNKDGSVAIESQVIDLLAALPPEKKIQCTSGTAMACAEYRKTRIPVVDSTGYPLQESVPCPKTDEGKDGCRCEKNTAGAEVCERKGQYVFQDVLDHACDPKDEIVYCPYRRAEEVVIDYEIEHECKDVKVDDQTSFLCLGGCSSKHELRCQEKTRKPVKAIRQVLNCIEDERERAEALMKQNKPVPELRATAHRIKECRRPQYRCARWNNACTRYSVNEAFHVVHEEIVPKWRPFAVEQGEYPRRFEEDIFLKFVSRNGRIAKDCRLSDFPRELRGSTLFVRIPTERNEDRPCDVPIWNSENVRSENLPKVYLKNAISFPERRLCGKTEYSFLTKEVPLSGKEEVIPSSFSHLTEVRIGPIAGSCTAPSPFPVGRDLWFTEFAPIRFQGRVSVLGRMLESVLTESKR